METTLLVPAGTKAGNTGFSFPLVVESTLKFVQFRSHICAKYPWGIHDAVEFRYWDIDSSVWVPVQCDAELEKMFRNHAHFPVKLEINVIQRKRGLTESSGRKSKSTSSRGRSRISRGRKTSVSSQKRASDAGESSMQVPGTPSEQVPIYAGPTQSRDSVDPNIEEGLPDDWPTDDEDERLFPQFVTKQKAKKTDDDGDEDYIPPPEGMFDEPGEDELEEDQDMGYSEDSDDGRPDVQYNRDDPSLKEGTIFSSALDCRNALATFSIKTQSEYVVDKSDPTRLTVHCAYKRCRWRMHASLMRNSSLFQVQTVGAYVVTLQIFFSYLLQQVCLTCN